MFHSRHSINGLFFERTLEGDVRILKRKEAREDAPIIFDVIVSASEWASIVAAVSEEGEKQENQEKALRFHLGNKQ